MYHHDAVSVIMIMSKTGFEFAIMNKMVEMLSCRKNSFLAQVRLNYPLFEKLFHTKIKHKNSGNHFTFESTVMRYMYMFL